MDDIRRLDAFRGTLRCPTVSVQSGETETGSFDTLHEHLRQAFPRVHRHLAPETVAGASLRFTWKGSRPADPPLLLTAHLDVVPAGNPEAWPFPPFSGALEGGRIWGRGAIDYKVGVSGMLQACEDLLGEGFRPTRTLCLAFGHDEEVGGLRGAAGIAELYAREGVRFAAVLDEGGYLYTHPWLRGTVAVVGLAEKGYLTLRLTARGEQGHASRPPLRTPCGRLGLCLGRLEEHQMPPRLCGPVLGFLEGTRSRWVPEHSVRSGDPLEEVSVLEGWPCGNALVRTTVAPTVLSGGCKENVLPAEVHALVNFRPIPGDTLEDVLIHVREAADPLGIEVTLEDPRRAFEPSAESSLDTPDGRALLAAVEAVWPGIPAVPGIFPAATDSRHYAKVADQVHRFVPVPLGSAGLGALHAEGESLGAEDYLRAVSFYRTYIGLAAGGAQG